jgi:hypothetical protein
MKPKMPMAARAWNSVMLKRTSFMWILNDLQLLGGLNLIAETAIAS